jgi:hypothetical protein
LIILIICQTPNFVVCSSQANYNYRACRWRKISFEDIKSKLHE